MYVPYMYMHMYVPYMYMHMYVMVQYCSTFELWLFRGFCRGARPPPEGGTDGGHAPAEHARPLRVGEGGGKGEGERSQWAL